MGRRVGGCRPRGASRRAAAATLSAAVVAAMVGTTPAGAASHGKRFVPGGAAATSQALQIAPRTGGLAAAITVGTSIADYRNSLGQASSQTVDLGLIGTDLTIQCSSAPPTLRPDQLPQPLVAESDHGNAHATKSTAGSTKSGALAAAGTERVRATTIPSALASFDGGTLTFPGVLSMSGLHSASHARLRTGRARIASATSRVGQVRLLGSKVVLAGMRWKAVQQTGAHRRARGTFTMQSATVAGHALPTSSASLKTTLDAVNQAIAYSGLHVVPPRRTWKHGKVTMTPMTIGISNSKLGAAIINPVTSALEPVTSALADLLTGFDCRLGNFLTLADLVLSAADGTGGMDLSLGGATATSDGKTYGDPFGPSGPPRPRGGRLAGSSGAAGAGSGPGPAGSVPGTRGAAASSRSSGSSPSVAGASTASASCATTSPAGRPSCSRGKGLMVGLIALGALAAFGVGDVVALRRRRRTAAR